MGFLFASDFFGANPFWSPNYPSLSPLYSTTTLLKIN